MDDTHDAEAILVNPFYAASFQDYLFTRQPAGAKEDWVLLNTKLMKDLGAEVWLNQLLDVLTVDEDEYDGHEIINPSLAVVISNGLQGKHETLVSRKDWIAANVKLAKEIDVTKWLWRLLDVLETGGPKEA